jgi:peptidoglycan hydrolase-like protein with peptidoglycan-binding domain
MQRMLIVLGYEPGPADGMMGKKTSDAVARFQSDRDLPVTGRLDSETIAAIENSQPDSTQDGFVEKRSAENADGAATEDSEKSENTITSNNCSVEMVLDMKEIGLTAEQIEAACSN